MSQSRNRRASSKARAVAREAPAPEPAAARRQGSRSKSNSRNKIPKSVRYDLENALLGLCDVWFEEIKPHLVRNNIKLHVDADESGEGEGAGDHRFCAHVDPGAAPYQPRQRVVDFADSCQTRRTASRAPSRRPPAPPPTHPQSPQQIRRLIEGVFGQASPPRAPPASASHSFANQNLAKKNRSSTKQNRNNRKARCALTPPPLVERATRPCRGGSVPPRARTASPHRPCPAPPPRHSVHMVPFPPPPPKTFEDKATQTMLTWKQIRPCLTIDLRSLPQDCNLPRTPALYPTKHKKKKKKIKDNTQLYPNDLIDIIGAQHDKRLRLIFKNPKGEESYHSVMNLVPSRKRRKGAVSRTPWR